MDLTALTSVFRYATRYVKNTMNRGFVLDKVIVFDESGEEDVHSEFADKHLTLDELKKSIALDEYRIEFRYRVNGKKFRAIVRKDDAMAFPIRKELGLRAEFQVTHAVLLPHEGHHIDVTNRVKKYAGQNGDFNAHAGSFLFVSDMFPYYDVDDYARLMLLDEHSEKILVYSMHDIVNTSVVI
ncbi:hypothetical protein ATCVOR07043_377L [Acanthocystis turfacea Chlorella virus OR0704.3]|nr:hypothetical protein ATCVOR07043_377L [Acanthocystis turfacea Chlorella virus OR0704.3]